MSHSLASYSPKQLLKADLVLVVVTLLAAAGWIFSKETLLGLPPLLFMGLRFLCGGALVALLAARHLARLNSEQWHSAVLVGLFMGAAMGIWIFGLHTTKSLGEGAFITSLSVVVVPMVNWLLFKQRPTRVTFIALPIAIIGMALLSLRHGFTPDPSQWYFFVAAMLLSVAFILNSRAAAKTPALALSAIQLLLVGAVTFCSSLLLESWPNFLDLPAAIWGWLFLSFTLATAGRF
ncbi:MAG: EamA family transporter, partial [Venatoribacter sp.]